MTDWPRVPLRPEDYAAIERVRWSAVAKDVAIAVAEGWNAGVDTKPMADAMRVSPGTYRVLIGKLTQIGVKLRPAKRRAQAAMPKVGRIVVATPAPALTAPATPAMRRLAAFDPVVARALEARERAA